MQQKKAHPAEDQSKEGKGKTERGESKNRPKCIAIKPRCDRLASEMRPICTWKSRIHKSLQRTKRYESMMNHFRKMHGDQTAIPSRSH
jgi:hypothetical protein